MGSLRLVSSLCQQVAEIISSVLDTEVQIIDEDYTIIAGTGIYKQLLGTKDAEAFCEDSPYIYTQILQNAKSYIVEAPMETPIYGPTTQGETAEICVPIKFRNKVIGIMALATFDKEQRNWLLSKQKDLLTFLKQMATLITSSIVAGEAHNQIMLGKNIVDNVLETVDLGIIAVDGKGVITHLNKAAERLLGISSENWIGNNLDLLWPGSPLVALLKNGQECSNKEVTFTNKKQSRHLLATTKAFFLRDQIQGGLLSFSSLAEARTLAYDLINTDRVTRFDLIKGQSKSMANIKKVALRVARGNSTVLITGETGTGKELFARAIHYASPRRDEPLVTVNCAAIPETLLESELFGYEEGAFTGARKGGRAGKFEVANGGTLFLDEIGDMPLHLQPKLLHALERRQIERIGGNKVIDINSRIIAATNRNLEEMCSNGEFREDLYYRLNVIPLHIPPLRERKDDMELLTFHFLHKYSRLLNRNITGIADEVMQLLREYDWPGNVRELENVIEYAVNMELTKTITLDSIPRRVRNAVRDGNKPKEDDLRSQLDNVEEDLLRKYYEKTKTGELTKKEAADLLGISRSTFYRKLSKITKQSNG